MNENDKIIDDSSHLVEDSVGRMIEEYIKQNNSTSNGENGYYEYAQMYSDAFGI